MGELRAAHTAHIVSFMLGGQSREVDHMSLCSQLAAAGSEFLNLARDCYLVVATSQAASAALSTEASTASRKLSYQLQARNRPEMAAPAAPLLEDACVAASADGDAMEACAAAAVPPGGVSLLPNSFKAGMVGQYLNRERSVLHFHVMKTGGTTLCRMALANDQFSEDYLNRWGTPLARNCIIDMPQLRRLRPTAEYVVHEKPPQAVNPFFFSDEFLSGPARQTWPLLGNSFTSWEPAAMNSDWSLDHEWARMTDAGPAFWDTWLPVITMRHPVERAFSTLRFWNVTDHCNDIGLGIEPCVLGFLDSPSETQLEENFMVHRMLNEFTNVYVLHLSGTHDNLELAKRNLRKFHLILDVFKRRETSERLLEKVLGWKNTDFNSVSERISTFTKEGKTLESEYPHLYRRIASHMQLDLELYEYALDLLDQHAFELGVAGPPEPRVRAKHSEVSAEQMVMPTIAERIEALYRASAPEKLEDPDFVKRLMIKFKGREEQLLKNVSAKYATKAWDVELQERPEHPGFSS